MRAALACLALVACAGGQPKCPPPPPPPPTPAQTAGGIVVGQTFKLHSSVLGEDRTINVYLPPDYAKGSVSYPVLYALDGGVAEDFLHVAGNIDVATRNEVITPHIVVGIENVERRRDLVPATDIADEKKIAPHAGGTDRFRAFLKDDLLPEIARRFRVTSDAAIIGESFAGLFVLETLLRQPELFDTYIALDPSVWWNGGALVKGARDVLAKWTAKPKRLFIATADYKETQDRIAELRARFDTQKPPGLDVTYAPFPDEHHSTIFPVAESRAYRLLFARPTAP